MDKRSKIREGIANIRLLKEDSVGGGSVITVGYPLADAILQYLDSEGAVLKKESEVPRNFIIGLCHPDGQNWIERKKFTSSDNGSQDRFGNWISISGDYAVIGAHGNSDQGAFTGSAYIFKHTQLPVNSAELTGDSYIDWEDLRIFTNNWLQ